MRCPENVKTIGIYRPGTDGLVRDIQEAYPELVIENNAAVWDILSLVFNQTGHKFIFVIDEWDAVFHSSFITEKDKKDYLLFLKLLLKGQSYVELAYMTGVLPIGQNIRTAPN